jgi:hypothetical protein
LCRVANEAAHIPPLVCESLTTLTRSHTTPSADCGARGVCW